MSYGKNSTLLRKGLYDTIDLVLSCPPQGHSLPKVAELYSSDICSVAVKRRFLKYLRDLMKTETPNLQDAQTRHKVEVNINVGPRQLCLVRVAKVYTDRK